MEGEESSTVAPYLLRKNEGIRTVTGITSFLSILGSFLIIFSYIFFKDTRTRARLILLHLSITDLGVGLANFVGDVVYFDRYYINSTSIKSINNTAANAACITQAFLAEYFTISSILWTCVLAVYMYFLVVEKGSFVVRYFMWIACILCYGIPVMVASWLLHLGRLGYSPYNSAGWCSLKLSESNMKLHGIETNTENHIYRNYMHLKDIYVTIFAYDLWISTTIILTIVVYLSTHFYIRHENSLRTVSQRTGHSDALSNVEFKFLLIPVMFIVLRMWTFINNILFVYMGLSEFSKTVTQMMEYLTGIGDSGQGAVNGFIFVLLTRDIRKRLCSCACLRRCGSHDDESSSLLHYDHHSPNLNKSRLNPSVVARKQKVEKPQPEPPSVYTPVSSYED